MQQKAKFGKIINIYIDKFNFMCYNKFVENKNER